MEQSSPIYILTGNNHYFECHYPITANWLSDRTILFVSKEGLYKAVCDRLNLTVDEIDGMEYIIAPDGSVTMPRGYTFKPTECIEAFLNNYAE